MTALRKSSISDSDRASEYALQMELDHIVALMGDVIRRVNANSSLVKIDEMAWANFCSDELPNNLAWDEKINAARRGWDQ